MPKRTDLRSVLIVGSGPIRIGQGCEFDYAGVQACRALRGEGYRVVLVNSNPATIMTDPEWADATYLEPLDADTLAAIVAAERPDALLPTLGGQTALNLAVELAEAGVLAEFGVELIGANLDSIRTAEDRSRFRETMAEAGLPVPESVVVTSLAQLDECPLPAVVRPAFTLGGRGGGLASTREELAARVEHGLAASPIGQVLVERSLEGWQEYELEVVADTAGNCVVVCSIENLDPVGVHTGDSWTVAPQQTLPDGELQRLRDAAFACARAVGVATGGANVQFAYEPDTKELALIEMNPRVSRSSALASKATGFPIAKLAALLAVGYTLDELPNDITGTASAAFEPALDYVAVKAPRFDFAKFPGNDTAPRHRDARGRRGARDRPDVPRGAAEGARGRRVGRRAPGDPRPPSRTSPPSSSRSGRAESELAATGDVRAAKRFGLPDARIARILGIAEAEVRARRDRPGRLAVDSCAGEFEAQTPYYYLSHELGDDEPDDDRRDRRARLGHEPDRPGDRVRLLLRARGAGVPGARARGRAREREPGDRLDRLRHVRPPLPRARHARARARRRRAGATARRGRLARRPDTRSRSRAGSPMRERRCSAIRSLRSKPQRIASVSLLSSACSACERPRGGLRRQPLKRARSRPSWDIPCSCGPPTCSAAAACGSRAPRRSSSSSSPALVDRFLEGALELDVDVLCDGEDGWVAAILEHVERAGVHSGDSACVIPAPSVGAALEAEIRELARTLAQRSRRTRPAQPPARAARGRPVRARGESPRVPHGSVRRQGDRDPARRPRVPAAARRAPGRSRPARRASCPSARGRRRRSSRASASPVPPTGASRCARPAR